VNVICVVKSGQEKSCAHSIKADEKLDTVTTNAIDNSLMDSDFVLKSVEGKSGVDALKFVEKSDIAMIADVDDSSITAVMKCNVETKAKLSLTNPEMCEVNCESLSNLGEFDIASPLREDYTPVTTPLYIELPATASDVIPPLNVHFSLWHEYFVRNCKMHFNYDFLPGTNFSH
jgi:hypothetical protein